MKRRTPLQRSRKPMKRTRLNPVSKKRKEEQPQRNEWSAGILQRDPVCFWCGLTQSVDPHHVFAKGPFPALRTIPDNGIGVCRICHDFIDGRMESVLKKLEEERPDQYARLTEAKDKEYKRS